MSSALIALRQRELPKVVADNMIAAASFEQARPALDASDADLLAFLRSTSDAIRQALYQRFVDVTPRSFITSPATIPSLEELEAERPVAAAILNPAKSLCVQ